MLDRSDKYVNISKVINYCYFIGRNPENAICVKVYGVF
jgi:hypothetical protein